MIVQSVFENPYAVLRRSIAQTHADAVHQIRLQFLLSGNPPDYPEIEPHCLGGITANSVQEIDGWLRKVVAHDALADLLPEVTQCLRAYEINLSRVLGSQSLPHKNSHAVIASIREARLQIAVQMSDYMTVLGLLALGVNQNTAAADGCTPLMRAALGPDNDTCNVLLACRDIEVNAADKDGSSALMYAACSGNEDVAIALLNHPETDVNHADKHGITALMAAAENGHTRVVEALLKHAGIDVNRTDRKGDTALGYAAASDKADCVALLMSRPCANVDTLLQSLKVSVKVRKQLAVRLMGKAYIGLATQSPDRFKTMVNGLSQRSIELVLTSMLFGIHEREIITLEEMRTDAETLNSAIEAGSDADKTLRAIDHALSRLPKTESGDPDTQTLRETALAVDKFASQRFLTDRNAFGRFAGNEMVRMACNKVGFRF
jgi:ankyrin repeat protein